MFWTIPEPRLSPKALFVWVKWSLRDALGRGLFSRPWLGCKRWARVRFIWTHIERALTAPEHGTSDTCILIAWTIDMLNQYIERGPFVSASKKQHKIINHKVNKTMHSPELSESASLPHSRAIRNVRFPTYEVVTSSLHSVFLLNK